MASKLAVAFLLACPGCTGTLFIALAGAAGVGALMFKSVLLATVVGLVGFFWIRNAYRRRGECAMPQSLSRSKAE